MSLRRYDGPTLTLVINPAAGRGRARKLLPKVTSALLAGLPDADLRVVQSTSFADARLRCIAAVEAARPQVDGHRSDALLVMGGDGMMNLGLNAAAGTDVPLGLIPAGRGNDFCRGAGVPQQAMAAVHAIVEGQTRLVDGAERRWVGSIVSTGYDSRVNHRTNELSWSLGGLSYAWTALTELAVFEPVPYRIEIDGVKREQTAMLIAVGNAGFFGGGMWICPHADVTDGLLDVTIVNPVSRTTLLRLLPTMFKGTFIKDPAVELVRAKEVVIDGDGLWGMADGEDLGAVPLRLRAAPGHVALFTSRAPVAK